MEFNTLQQKAFQQKTVGAFRHRPTDGLMERIAQELSSGAANGT
jgi:hypothetical protein